MAVKRQTYVEPASYFNAAMKKADKEWDKKIAAEKKANKQSTNKKK